MVGVRVIVEDEKYTSVGGVVVGDMKRVGVAVQSLVGVACCILFSLVMMITNPRQ